MPCFDSLSFGVSTVFLYAFFGVSLMVGLVFCVWCLDWRWGVGILVVLYGVLKRGLFVGGWWLSGVLNLMRFLVFCAFGLGVDGFVLVWLQVEKIYH